MNGLKLLWTILQTLLTCSLVSLTEYGTCSKSENSCASEQASLRSAYGTAQHINVVIFGATGDLAKKYLWNSLLQAYEHYLIEHKLYKFSIYAVGRIDKPEGRKFLSEFFLGLPKCSTDECSEVKKGFSEIVRYIKVLTVRDFLAFKEQLDENTQSLYGLRGTQKSQEVGRLFYLAIPPSALLQTLERIHKHLMPVYGHPWVRLVLEKPFGNGLESVRSLSAQVSSYFNESQIYRVDHYLGKSVVQEILSFRTVNDAAYGGLWHRDHIDRVEVVMKEKLSVAGRTSTYDEMGVIRDVMQNHLTQMFALVSMELPNEGAASISQLHAQKLDVLQKTTLAHKKKVLTGQYSTYNSEWLAETSRSNEVTTTATFAATLLQVQHERWQGVPFVLVSGKKMEEKSSYVRLVFKREKEEAGERQLLFHVDGKLGQFIAASKDLPEIQFRKDWRLVESLSSSADIFGSAQKNLRIYVPRWKKSAYEEVLKGVIDASRHLFVPLPLLQESWRIWDEVLSEARHLNPRKYLGLGKDVARLAFKASIEDGLEFELTENYTQSTL